MISAAPSHRDEERRGGRPSQQQNEAAEQKKEKKKVRKENGADRKQVFSQREAGSSLHGHQHLDINTVRLRHCCVINSLPFF